MPFWTIACNDDQTHSRCCWLRSNISFCSRRNSMQEYKACRKSHYHLASWWSKAYVEAHMQHHNTQLTIYTSVTHCLWNEDGILTWYTSLMQDRLHSYLWWREMSSHFNNKVILTGYKDPLSKIWTLPICQEEHRTTTVSRLYTLKLYGVRAGKPSVLTQGNAQTMHPSMWQCGVMNSTNVSSVKSISPYYLLYPTQKQWMS